jgi:ferric-dicitrate binding protein FerR (iron transport regulator)
MTSLPRGVLCERARTWAALAPDGELAELERHLLDAHLARCASCSRFADEVAEIAAALRREALRPLSHPVSVPAWRRRTVYARVRTVGAAAAVALMALGVASRAPLPMDPQSDRGFQPRVLLVDDERTEMAELRAVRREILVADGRVLNSRFTSRHFGDQSA